MRQTKMMLLRLALLLCVAATLASTIYSQGRRAASASASGRSEANKFWNAYIPSCGGARYMRKAAGIFAELRGFRVVVNYDAVTEADRLNGVESKGTSSISATSSRVYSNGAWRAWQNGLPEDASLVNSVRFQKTRGGGWRFYGTGYFNDYARRLTCSDVPGLTQPAMRGQPSATRSETPTNSIQIGDTHVFPIQQFVVWESSSNEAGSRFSQSSATYINWKIIYQETAFDYRPPSVETYWYKDGKQWAHTVEAHFSNTGAGQLWSGEGWSEPGRWETGSYAIKIYVRGRLVRIGRFDIVPDEQMPARLRYDGIYRLDNPPVKGYVYLLRFYEDGTVLFGRTSETNKSGLALNQVGACLIKKQPYMGCGAFEIVADTYSRGDGAAVSFGFDFQNGAVVSYSGTYGHNALTLESSESDELADRKLERFVFSQVRLY